VMVRDWQRGRSNRSPHKREKQPRKLGLSCCHCPQVPRHFPKKIQWHESEFIVNLRRWKRGSTRNLLSLFWRPERW
jgi:hypothetical protein